MRVYNDVDGSLLGTYHGGHCDENSNSNQHLIVVSTSGRISASWSSDGSVTRTGFSCSFTSGTFNKLHLSAISKRLLSVVVTMYNFILKYFFWFQLHKQMLQLTMTTLCLKDTLLEVTRLFFNLEFLPKLLTTNTLRRKVK